MNQSILGLVGVLLIAAATYLYWPQVKGLPGSGSSATQAKAPPAAPAAPRGPVFRTIEEPATNPPAGGQPR
jgi:hypothetical protein